MATERTFSILKPDATKRNLTGAINAIIEKAGLRIVAQKRVGDVIKLTVVRGRRTIVLPVKLLRPPADLG